MDKTTIEVSIYLRVYDEKAFRDAAYQRALTDGLEQEEAARYKNEEDMGLSDCARMLIDPGQSPDGCEILDSACEVSTN